jgi:hypothetical protein
MNGNQGGTSVKYNAPVARQHPLAAYHIDQSNRLFHKQFVTGLAFCDRLSTIRVEHELNHRHLNMARNLKFFFDPDGTPRARGPATERILMTFLEVDVQGSDAVCHDLMDDITAIEDKSDDMREFNGNAHAVTIRPDGVTIESQETAPLEQYSTGLKHFREILEDWEAFILDDQPDDQTPV